MRDIFKEVELRDFESYALELIDELINRVDGLVSVCNALYNKIDRLEYPNGRPRQVVIG